MNAPVFNRREFTAGLGAIVVAFSLNPKLARGQERLPGSLQNNRRLDGWIRINADGTATVFTGKVGWGRASSPRSRRSRPKSSICRCLASR